MLFNSERKNYDMDITEYFLAILLLLLPIFAFTSGKIILQRQGNVKKTAPKKISALRSSYVISFLAGTAYAIALFFLAAIGTATLINTINDLSIEFGVLFTLVCAIGFFTVKSNRKLFKKFYKQQAENPPEVLSSVLPFCFGTIGGITAILSLGVLEDAFLDNKGIINTLIGWYSNSLLSNDLLGAIILWLLWITFIVISCLFTIITTIVLMKKQNQKGK